MKTKRFGHALTCWVVASVLVLAGFAAVVVTADRAAAASKVCEIRSEFQNVVVQSPSVTEDVRFTCFIVSRGDDNDTPIAASDWGRITIPELSIGLPQTDQLIGLVDQVRNDVQAIGGTEMQGGDNWWESYWSVPVGTSGGGTGGSATAGYWMVGADGNVYPFGGVQGYGNPSGKLGFATAVKLEPTPSGAGYYIVTNLGAVFTYGDAKDLGQPDLRQLAPGELVTTMTATPTGAGYWVFTTRGRVLTVGDAKNLGDMSSTHLNGPVLGSIATPSGKGYYMVASDGGIFAFGDATFRGSMGSTRLNAPVQSLVPTADGKGYWLVASDGGIFAFGSATFRGSMGSTRLNKPVVGMVRYGNGYLMVASDGGIFSFSDLPFFGSLGDKPPARPITSVGAFGT